MKQYVLFTAPDTFDMTYIFELKGRMATFPYEKEYSVIFDFSKTKFLSSLGVGVLLYISARLCKHKAEMRLLNVSTAIKNTFHLLGADQELNIADHIPPGWQEVTL